MHAFRGGGGSVMETITWDDFSKVELRVGRIIDARVFAEARKPAYVLQVDFGEEIGVRKSSAQITKLYLPEELVGKLVVGVVNFPKKQIGPLMSECLVTGFHDANGMLPCACPTSRCRWARNWLEPISPEWCEHRTNMVQFPQATPASC